MNELINNLKQYIDASPCNVWAVANASKLLRQAGFTPLDTRDAWSLRPGARHYVIKNSTAIFAFVAGSDPAAGYRIISAHSDSPGFRIKPAPEMLNDGNILKLNTEVYGGPILYTWFDRPLSIAGRVVLRSADVMEPEVRNIRFGRPLLTIPHLAIHYNRSVNEGNEIRAQRDMLPVLAMINDKAEADGYLLRLLAEHLDVAVADILDFDLTLYDTTPGCTFGVHDEFFSSGRIDDLEMAHAAVTSLIAGCDGDCTQTRIAAIFDNEETGSGTRQGAASPVLRHLLQRINAGIGGTEETLLRAIDSSFMISADNAHGTHPNYVSKQDPTNHPVLGGGPVIKYNANCKYMTDSVSAAIFKGICDEAGVKYQEFVNHSDIKGGSTLGNILTSQIDLRGVDMGAAQWAMHSVRETASCSDYLDIVKVFTTFYAR